MTPAQAERLRAFHAHQGHPGEPKGCGKCADQAARQRAGAKALRAARGHNTARATDPRGKR